ncbi:hypothetical protein FOA43_000285 [Brettanomyces nanus]|uniref:Smr domain-containing protein n=1 Tax=Eeniella nana TaxID=13502 RepID=A0A875RVK3_EENNA|nr:uncharacterized protein FOA43_000285 [Brettanomyces nanus]QPG72981.1 hypothetical protein FOA43_000285 [Brettanomyces nanus]
MGKDNPDLELRSKLLQLSEMFPDIPLGYINETLVLNKGDAARTTDELLNYKVTETEKTVQAKNYGVPSDTDNESDHSVSNNNEIYDDKMSVKELKEWIRRIDFVEEVLDLLKLEAKYKPWVEYYSEQHNYKLLDTVSKMIENFDPDLPPEKQQTISYRTLATVSKMQDHSDDQNSSRIPVDQVELSPDPIIQKQSAAHLLAKVKATTYSKIQGGYTVIRPSAKQQKNEIVAKSVKVDMGSESMKELIAIRESNVVLLRLPMSFYVNGMRFFENSVEAVIYVASVVAPLAPFAPETPIPDKLYSKEIMATAAPKQPPKSDCCWSNRHPVISERGPSFDNLLSSAKRMQSKAAMCNDKKIKPIYASTASEKYREAFNSLQSGQAREIRAKVEQSKQTNQIDLHGLLVDSALQCCKEAVSSWWQDEINARVIHGDSLRPEKAVHVEYFRVVTGRGMHSAGGVPRIKHSVRKYLTRSHYIFEEESSALIVRGKRH